VFIRRSRLQQDCSTVLTTLTTTTKEQRPDRFENMINRYKARGFNIVADFLSTKARKSLNTAISYSHPLDYLNSFIEQNYKDKDKGYNYNIQTILKPLQKGKIDVYRLLNSFVPYLQNNTKNGPNLVPKSIDNYMIAARSYFQYNDIEISPAKFKYKVSMPPMYREDEEAIGSTDIKEILNHCNNRRLKAYLLVLASGGMRAKEALSLRECDIDFSEINFADPNDRSEPARVHIRKEFSKTRIDRYAFISNEAARYLHEWIEWKYRDRTKENKQLVNRVRNKEQDLIFSVFTYIPGQTMATIRGGLVRRNRDLNGLYIKIMLEFQKLLKTAGFTSRKEDGVFKRRKITLHSFRRFVKTTVSNQTRNSDYSEWLLGHRKSVYWVNKPEELKRIYREDCMRYLTFLDYPTLEATGRSFEAQLKQKDKEIVELKAKIGHIELTKELESKQNADVIGDLAKSVEELQKEVKELKSKH